jgi:NAD(P)-dependent dehydrogenase (short-subunit alcohol dehydrogenase family)
MRKKVAVVVGGTGQIGNIVIDDLLRSEYLTICISSSEKTDIERKSGVDYIFGDMTRLEQIEKCRSMIADKYKKVDVLINAIGKNKRSSIGDITEEMWNEIIEANLKSVFFICRTFANLIQKDNGGTIINLASTAGIRALPQYPHYIAAKAGVIALTKFYAKALAPKARVNCIAPGFVLTTNHLPESYANYDSVVSRLPLKQMTSIEEVAEAVIYLASSKTITGHTLVIDGGLTL